EKTLLFVIEDLQWADLATVQLLEVALRELEDARLAVLALSRPEGPALFPRLWPERSQTLLLHPLGRKAREQLVRQVLGRDGSPEIVARIALQSAGNALYLEELIRAAAAGKGEAPPATVMAMLQTRIGRLESGARRVLRAASVFGDRAL